jgi:hypothetical protein
MTVGGRLNNLGGASWLSPVHLWRGIGRKRDHLHSPPNIANTEWSDNPDLIVFDRAGCSIV